MVVTFLLGFITGLVVARLLIFFDHLRTIRTR